MFTIMKGVIHIISTLKGRGGGVKPNAYDCVQGGREGFEGWIRTQKKTFLDRKISKLFFFVQKKLLHCYSLLRIEKCKPALSYK